MPNPKFESVDSLWEVAKSGSRKLTAAERRRVLIYLEEIGEAKHTVVELSKWFQVSESVIREDRKRFVSDLAKELSPEFAMQFIARHLADIEQLINIARAGLKAQDPGNLGESRYIDTLGKLLKERRETLEKIGVIRQELGAMNTAEEEWIATVSEDGACDVKRAE